MPIAVNRAASGPRYRLRAAAAFGAAGLSLALVQSVAGIGIPCPWRALTHTLCPLCGATTMGAHLLHGDFGAAWSANPFVFVLLSGLVLATMAWTLELLGGPAVRLPARLADQRVWYATLAVAGLVFAVVRNIAG
nr:DUF2752 domain-containing protein [Propionicimonas sp.]